MEQKFREVNLGKNILKFRRKKKITQQKAAELYGCSLRWWQAVERGRNISIFVLYKIATVLTVDAWKLLKA